MKSNIGSLLVIGYIAAGFLTFGHVFNVNYAEPAKDCGPKPDVQSDEWDDWYWCKHPPYIATTEGASAPAMLAGLVWPFYWGGHFAIKVTK